MPKDYTVVDYCLGLTARLKKNFSKAKLAFLSTTPTSSFWN